MKYKIFVVLALWVGLCAGCMPIANQPSDIQVGSTPTPYVEQVAKPTVAEQSQPTTITATEIQTSTPALISIVTSTVTSQLPDPSQVEMSDAEWIERGVEVYRQHYCGICHELEAANTKGQFGPSHNGMGAIAAERIQSPAYRGAATTPEAYLLESLVEPERHLVAGYESTPHRMPSYTFLDEADLHALVQMLLR